MMHENIIQTPYGIFSGISTASYYSSGIAKDIILNEKNMVVTHAGELIPYYEETARKKYKPSVGFHPNGMIKSISLNGQQEIMTPIGDLPGELVTFYDTGELKRIFILDGKISGFWSEEDERKLNIPLSFEFDFAKFSAMLIGICFYKSGDIKSITLFPNESIEICTENHGTFSVKTGFSLYESGKLKSFEPAAPSEIETPIGIITAYDVNSVGITADSNSIELDESGHIKKVITSIDKIMVQQENGAIKFFMPLKKQNPLEEKEIMTIPVSITFDKENDMVSFTDEKTHEFSISNCKFDIIKSPMARSPSDCASCSLCSHQ